jgi:hypothetical protein
MLQSSLTLTVILQDIALKTRNSFPGHSDIDALILTV